MKKVLFTLFFAGFIMIPLFAQQANPSQEKNNNNEADADGPKAKWEVLVADLGEVPARTSKDAEFKLTNTGNKPLIITSARASCGCTNLKYSRDPVLPGESTALSVTFNGSGNGPFTKTISVQTNESQASTVLRITGTVVNKTSDSQ